MRLGRRQGRAAAATAAAANGRDLRVDAHRGYGQAGPAARVRAANLAVFARTRVQRAAAARRLADARAALRRARARRRCSATSRSSREHSRARWDHRGSSRARRGAARRGRARGRDRVDARRFGSEALAADDAARPSSISTFSKAQQAPGVGARAAHPAAREGTRRGVALGVGARAQFTSATDIEKGDEGARSEAAPAPPVGARRDRPARGTGRSRSWRRWDASWPRGRATCPTGGRRVGGVEEGGRADARESSARPRPSSTTGATFRFRARTPTGAALGGVQVAPRGVTNGQNRRGVGSRFRVHVWHLLTGIQCSPRCIFGDAPTFAI